MCWLYLDHGAKIGNQPCLLSQDESQLAKESSASIRTIHLFEQCKSNINNAQYNHLSAIAKVRGCEVEDLLD